MKAFNSDLKTDKLFIPGCLAVLMCIWWVLWPRQYTRPRNSCLSCSLLCVDGGCKTSRGWSNNCKIRKKLHIYCSLKPMFIISCAKTQYYIQWGWLIRTLSLTNDPSQNAEDALKQREVMLASKLVNLDSKRAEYSQVIRKLDETRYWII